MIKNDANFSWNQQERSESRFSSFHDNTYKEAVRENGDNLDFFLRKSKRSKNLRLSRYNRKNRNVSNVIFPTV